MLSCGYEFWQNSKPAVSALIEKTDKEGSHPLLARRAIEPHKGMWGIPGGYLDNGERPEDGLRREIQEELGIALEYAELFCVRSANILEKTLQRKPAFYSLCIIAAKFLPTPCLSLLMMLQKLHGFL